ncbi:phosphotransferase enzyme family protein [Saccharothrix sp. ALI-22-I]|uniref:phosphotransferase enzyme family protein n=1 Tax=Saccharothrix sp. ALI-22-I TaxID=1933778 RepID=UPI001EE6F763|nr:aminoglycoside phosphotransferase family protein [Saccharothrix sp. ALI-22-I]
MKAGVATTGAELIRDGTNAIYRLPGEVVARVGPPGSGGIAARQIMASQWLADASIPVVRALDHVEQPTIIDDRPVTWWARLPEHRHADPAELGATLRRLHALAVPDSHSFPIVDPFDGLSDAIARGTVLSETERTWLRHLAEQLHTEYQALLPQLPLCLIHGDAWQGNVVVPSRGTPVLLDLDHMGIGPPQWDLVSLAADYTDFARITQSDYHAFVDAYGGYDMVRLPHTGDSQGAALGRLRPRQSPHQSHCGGGGSASSGLPAGQD